MGKENRAQRYKVYQERASTIDPSPEAQDLKKGAVWQMRWLEKKYPAEFGVKEVVKEEIKSKKGK